MVSGEKSNGKAFGIILLAAGRSSRFGRPKQLLIYAGQTLLQHSIQVAGTSKANPLMVVLGAHADSMKNELHDQEVHLLVNSNWKEGMASSIRCGISSLMQFKPEAEGAILMVCDQPYVTNSIINDLIAVHQDTGKPIVACRYAGTFGPPTLFHRSMFGELLRLKGDVGAKRILRKHVNDMEMVLFPAGSVDIDTGIDYQELVKRNAGEC